LKTLSAPYSTIVGGERVVDRQHRRARGLAGLARGARGQRQRLGRRGDQGQRLGDVHDAAARRHQRRLIAVEHRDVVLAEPAGREPGAPGQLVGGDHLDLAPVEGRIEVEPVERAVGDRRAYGDAVVRAGQRQIVEVAGGARDLGDAVDARQAADRTGRGSHWPTAYRRQPRRHKG
jgi:hypothetical protein